MTTEVRQRRIKASHNWSLTLRATKAGLLVGHKGKHRKSTVETIVAKDKNYSSNVFLALRSLYTEQFEGHLLDEYALGYLDEALDTATEYFDGVCGAGG